MKSINLDELEKEAHTVTKAGVSYRVRPVTPRVTGILKAAEQSTAPAEKMQLYYDAVALLVPMMPRDDVDDLSATQLLAIVELAATQVDAVEEAANPNAASPAKATTPGEATTSAASS